MYKFNCSYFFFLFSEKQQVHHIETHNPSRMDYIYEEIVVNVII